MPKSPMIQARPRARALLGLLIAAVVACHRGAGAPDVPPVPPPAVLDVAITDTGFVVLPVAIGTRDSLPFEVDLGASLSVATPEAIAATGAPPRWLDLTMNVTGITGARTSGARIVALDSLRIGTRVHRALGMLHATPPPGSGLAGIVGNDLLRHYDLEFDLVGRRLRLYARDSAPPVPQSWICIPSAGLDTGFVTHTVELDGKPVAGVFDSGSPWTYMNWAAAELVGLTPDSPTVTRVADMQGVTGSTAMWEVRGVRLTLGGVLLADRPIQIIRNDQTPYLNLGLDHFRDRILLVSYSRGEVCLSDSP